MNPTLYEEKVVAFNIGGHFGLQIDLLIFETQSYQNNEVNIMSRTTSKNNLRQINEYLEEQMFLVLY